MQLRRQRPSDARSLAEADGYLDAAEDHLRAAVTFARQERDYPRALAEYYLGRARDEVARGRPERASEWAGKGLNVCLDHLDRGPDDLLLHTMMRARLDPVFGTEVAKPVKALQRLEERRATGQPLTFDLLLDYADACKAVGEPAREAEALRQLLASLPDGPSPRRTELDRRLAGSEAGRR